MIQIFLKINNALIRLAQSIFSIAKVICFSKFSLKLPKSTQTKVAILGNGPSLNASLQKDSQFLIKTELICVNHFVNSTYFTELKPTNYLLLDDAFMDSTHPLVQETLKNIITKTTWPLNLLVPVHFRKSNFFKQIISTNPIIKIYYFNYTILKGFDWLIFRLFNRNLGMPQCQNVLVAAIFTAINLGFQEIYLFGADHSWHEMIKLDENNQLYALDSHFYGSKTYDTQKIAEQSKGSSYLSKQFLSLYKVFRGYEILAKYSQFCGVKILNASRKSYIDIFDKVKVSD